jgi:hypothetical protein
MSEDEKMLIDERYKYLRMMQRRYAKANRRERRVLLDEMEAMTGCHRKSLIRHMKGVPKREKRGRQRGRVYGAEVEDALRVIVPSFDYLCAERLRPNLEWMASQLEKHGELEVSESLRAQLREISTATVGRILVRIGRDDPRLPRKGPARANQVRREVPMERIGWDETEPGHFEVDTVHHSGSSASGEYVHTLQMIDVATGWSERVAVLGRSYRVMQDGFLRIQLRLPFPICELHPDNGSEFFNDHLVAFWKESVTGVRLSRSRPYHKNDNRFVEQKNDTLVRAYLGNERLDTVAQTLAMNRLYNQMWLYYNLFQPVMRLCAKQPVMENGEQVRIRRRYDEARTPFDRLCAANVLPPTQRTQLEQLRDRINPRQLRQNIYDAIDQLFALPCAQPGVTEDIFATLMAQTGPPPSGDEWLALTTPPSKRPPARHT